MVPTVRIKHAVVDGNSHGFVDINKEDYDANPSAFELYVEEPVKQPEPVADPEPAPQPPAVSSEGESAKAEGDAADEANGKSDGKKSKAKKSE